ncbi:MAG: CHASE3 domain-containing protein [Actinomycetota bacterium]
MSGGLTRRMAVASGLLALVVSAAFVVLLISVEDLRTSERLALHSQEVLTAANQLERLVVDVETGQRGFVITNKEKFLDPWRDARRALPGASQRLEQLTAGDRQHEQAERIGRAAAAYVQDYSVPLVTAAQRDPDSVRTEAATDEGRQKIDAIRAEFDRLVTAERSLALARERQSDAAAGRAIAATVGGLVGSALLVLLFAGYLTRAIVQPVRRAAAMAGQLAGGDLAVRMPETGVDEVGALERSFNTMAGSLERSRDELTRLLDEQAALRRVATLVARAVPPGEIFSAVATEVGRLVGADDTAVVRFEPDGTAVVVVGLGEDRPPVGTRWRADDVSAITRVWRTGHSARVDDDLWKEAPGPLPDTLRRLHVRSAAASPIVVEGRLWGALSVATTHAPLPADTEQRMADFTDLVATAMANAESRAELAASRVRIVTAADDSRRQIERDLHDGIQQRLVSLGLELRAAQSTAAAEDAELGKQLERVAGGLGESLTELQELSRGIHPAILSEGGLGPALRALARRSAVPVELDLELDTTRLPASIEVAAYYVVSEALTNAAKHAKASVVDVHARAGDGLLRLVVRDDGVGGATVAHGSGLIGLSDRVQALGGTITVRSPAGEGTTLEIDLPVGG